MKALSFALALVFASGCGGALGTPLLDGGGGGTDGGGGGGDGGPTTDAGPPGVDGGVDCAKLLADLEARRQAAIQCCVTCNVQQCSQQVDGLCCPLTITSADSFAVKQYESTLAAVKSSGCTYACPGVTCSVAPSNVCQQSGTCAQ
jgi:hypothetical protein